MLSHFSFIPVLLPQALTLCFKFSPVCFTKTFLRRFKMSSVDVNDTWKSLSSLTISTTEVTDAKVTSSDVNAKDDVSKTVKVEEEKVEGKTVEETPLFKMKWVPIPEVSYIERVQNAKYEVQRADRLLKEAKRVVQLWKTTIALIEEANKKIDELVYLLFCPFYRPLQRIGAY